MNRKSLIHIGSLRVLRFLRINQEEVHGKISNPTILELFVKYIFVYRKRRDFYRKGKNRKEFGECSMKSIGCEPYGLKTNRKGRGYA